MKRVLLSTGTKKIDEALWKAFNNDQHVELINQAVYFREGLSDQIARHKPDVVVLSDFLDGTSISQKELIRIIRKRHPNVRVVYITKSEDNTNLRKFLFTLSVYDVISLLPKLDVKEFKFLLVKGKEWKDVAHYFSDLDPSEAFKIDESSFFSDSDEEENEEYDTLGVRKKQDPNSTLRQFVSFWGIRAQSGTTTLATNTALMLAQNKEDRVLLVDFNLSNPNVHLHFSMSDHDGNHNLAALMEDVEKGRVNNLGDIKKYILFHKSLTNVHIIPGFILKNPPPSEDTVDKTINALMLFAKHVGYSSVIFDLEPGLHSPISLSLLKKSDKVILPLIETPGSIIGLQKFFDTEYGPFYLNFLDVKKLFPVLNNSSHSDISDKIEQLVGNVLNRKVYAKIPRSEEIFEDVSRGVPILRQEPGQSILREFIKLANTIHNIFIVPSLDTKKRSIFKKQPKK